MSAATFQATESTGDISVSSSVKELLNVNSYVAREDMDLKNTDLNSSRDNLTDESSVSGCEKYNLGEKIRSVNGNVESNLQCFGIDKSAETTANIMKDEVINSTLLDDKDYIAKVRADASSTGSTCAETQSTEISYGCLSPLNLSSNIIASKLKKERYEISSRVSNVENSNDSKTLDQDNEMPTLIAEERQSFDNCGIPSEASEVSTNSGCVPGDLIHETVKTDQTNLGRSTSCSKLDDNTEFDKTLCQNSTDSCKNTLSSLEEVQTSKAALHLSENDVLRNDANKSNLSFDAVSTNTDVKNLSVISASNGEAQLGSGDGVFAHDRKLDTSSTNSTKISNLVHNSFNDEQMSQKRDQSFTSSELVSFSAEHHKTSKTKSKSPPDNMRPVGRILHDLGLDLVRQEVYKDLIDIQAAKDSNHRLDDKDKGQLIKLTEAHTKLKLRNHQYVLSRVRCAQCRYVTTTRNVLQLHREYGHCSRAGVHSCCVCESFRTRYASQFITHMETVHAMNGRLAKKTAAPICSYCPYEHKNSTKVEEHTNKCVKKFQLSSNLQPLPSDCDIPIRYKLPPSSWPRNTGVTANQYDVSASPALHVAMATSAASTGLPRPQGSGGSRGGAAAPGVQPPSVMEIGGQLYSWGNHNGKPLLTSLRSQIGNNGAVAVSHGNVRNNYNVTVPTSAAVASPLMNVSAYQLLTQQQELARARTSVAPLTPASHRGREPCEICGAIVDSRESLWMHLQSTHKVQLSRASMNSQEPIACEMCKSRFWTYQGLARHSLLLHKRNSSSSSSLVSPRGVGAGSNTQRQQGSFKCHLCGVTQSSNPLNHLSTHHNVTLLDMYHGRQCCMCNRKLRTGRLFEEHMIQEHRDIFANIDVLRTVLQALSTALCLKSEDGRPGGGVQGQQQQQQQHKQQVSLQQQRQQQGSSLSAGINSMSHHTVGSNNSNNRFMSPDVGHRAPVRSAPPELSHSQKRKQTMPRSSKDEIISSSATTPDKKSTEEDTKTFNKLYQDYGDIGRPISRAMKQKLLLNAPNKPVEVGLDLSCRKIKRDNEDGVLDNVVVYKKRRVDSEENEEEGPVSNNGEKKIDVSVVSENKSTVESLSTVPSPPHTTLDDVA